VIARVTMGRRSTRLTEGPCCSALITNCDCYEDLFDKLDFHKTLKLGIFLRVHENLECILGCNLDYDMNFYILKIKYICVSLPSCDHLSFLQQLPFPYLKMKMLQPNCYAALLCHHTFILLNCGSHIRWNVDYLCNTCFF